MVKIKVSEKIEATRFGEEREGEKPYE